MLVCTYNHMHKQLIRPEKQAWQKIYRASATKINDLVHTKLDVKFDYAKAWMYGKGMDHIASSFLSNRFFEP